LLTIAAELEFVSDTSSRYQLNLLFVSNSNLRVRFDDTAAQYEIDHNVQTFSVVDAPMIDVIRGFGVVMAKTGDDKERERERERDDHEREPDVLLVLVVDVVFVDVVAKQKSSSGHEIDVGRTAPRVTCDV
jgi:hypothetical protein